MIVSSSFAEAHRSSFVYEQTGSVVTPYFGLDEPSATDGAGPEVGALFPVAFHLEFAPDVKSGAHFHVANQFQVFVGGRGTMGKDALNPVSVHFAAAYSPYGPLAAVGAGFKYFTLRNGVDPGGIHYMPQSRAELAAAKRRPRVASADAVGAIGAPIDVARGQVACDVLIGPFEDGLAAWKYRLAPGQHVTGPDPASSGGQYWLVLSGAGALAETPLAELSCLFASPDAGAQNVRAGEDGVEFLMLQFPAN